MTTTDINSSAVIYHISSGSGDSASKWQEGAARKGVYDGRVNMSILMFPADTIAETIGEDGLIGADLILRRDTAYGVGAAMISVAPLSMGAVPTTYMSRSQIIGMAMRKLHRNVTVEGSTVSIRLSAATLREIKAGTANAFLLYGEEDGTDSYARMSTAAVLRLYTGEDWMIPEWTRSLLPGDVISSDIYSHITDLREIEYALNIRRVYDHLDPIADIGGTYDLGAFEDWADIIGLLRDGVDDCLDAESRDPHTWAEVTAGQLPAADVVEDIKAVIRGDDEQKITCEEGITAQFVTTKESAGIGQDASVTFEAGGYVKAGTTKSTRTTVKPDGTSITVAVWEKHMGGWVFDRGENPVPITSASLELTIKKAADGVVMPHVRLYGLKISQAGSVQYKNVFDSAVIGEMDCKIGEPQRIIITAEGLALLNAGTIHGVGMNIGNDYVECAKQANLLINNEAEEEEEPAEEETPTE